MLPIVILTALVLLAAIIVVIVRALNYIGQHPELVTDSAPLAYQRCQITLTRIIERYKQIEPHVSPHTTVTLQPPNGTLYLVSDHGVERRSNPSRPNYHLPWAQIGGVGVRMQPGFKVVDHNRDGWADSQYTVGYSFHLLIVPLSGDTMDIHIPTDQREDAVDFAAHTLALAHRRKKRINVFGFDKPPAPYRQRVPKA